MGTARRRGPDMDTFFSGLLWFSVAALIFALALNYQDTYGEGRRDIFDAD